MDNMKVKASIKKICEHCKIIKRHGHLLIQNINNDKVNKYDTNFRNKFG